MDKKAFYIFQEDLVKITPSDSGVCITEIVNLLNLYCSPNMRKLRTVQISSFLVKKGYLYEADKGVNRPTQKGKLLGIYIGRRESKANNTYLVNLYNGRAQQYIFDHLYDILS